MESGNLSHQDSHYWGSGAGGPQVSHISRKTTCEVLTVFCRECGAGISPDSKFCKECGAKIGGSVKTMALTVQDLEPVAGDVNQERLAKLLDMAFWHNDAGNLDAAIKACEAALVINPASTTAHSLLSTLYEKKGNDERAIDHLQAVLEINPDSIADQTKLDQLRRGVHVKAIQPPPAYRWLPPALTSLTSAGFKVRLDDMNDRRVGNVRLMPLVYSALAVLVVLGVGFAAVRASQKPVQTATTQTNSDVPIPPQVATTQQPIVQPAPQPFVSTAAPALAVSTKPAAAVGKTKKPVVADTPDVFGASDDPVARKIFNDAESRVMGGAPIPARTNDAGPGTKALPPLTAVPLNAQPIAPAEVDLPRPIATTTNLPQHTVVVSQLNSDQGNAAAPPPAAAAPQPQVASNDTSNNGGLVPVVRVTVHDSSSGNTEVNRGSSPSTVTAVHNDEGQAYQQYALSLQQQGDYKGAKVQYERAIRSYKARIREGHDSDDVQRGLHACQTGLEICQQSL